MEDFGGWEGEVDGSLRGLFTLFVHIYASSRLMGGNERIALRAAKWSSAHVQMWSEEPPRRVSKLGPFLAFAAAGATRELPQVQFN